MTHEIWVHRTMDLCHPVSKVLDLAAERPRKLGRLDCPENP